MKTKTGHILAAVLAALFFAGCALLLHASRERRAVLACEHVEVELMDSLRFVTENQVKSWLDRNYGTCVGKRLDSLDLAGIEKMLLSRGPITGCEAWTDDAGVLHLEISQRSPVLRFSYATATAGATMSTPEDTSSPCTTASPPTSGSSKAKSRYARRRVSADIPNRRRTGRGLQACWS